MFFRKDKRGFTATELLVGIAIIAIAAALAVPDIIQWGPGHRLKSAARDVVSNLQRARLEAVKRNTNQVVIRFTTGAYDPAGEVGTYMIFVDDGAGGGVAADNIRNGTESILVQVTMPRHVSMTGANFLGNTWTGFSPSGLPSSQGNVVVQNNQADSHNVVLSPAGNIRIQ